MKRLGAYLVWVSFIFALYLSLAEELLDIDASHSHVRSLSLDCADALSPNDYCEMLIWCRCSSTSRRFPQS